MAASPLMTSSRLPRSCSPALWPKICLAPLRRSSELAFSLDVRLTGRTPRIYNKRLLMIRPLKDVFEIGLKKHNIWNPENKYVSIDDELANTLFALKMQVVA
ncbi:Uncharacterized protein Fot_21838 [Forsythia ovata]|uniref:Uncharacterized protein n=1 Tax=Forsythia ovata TaxID=205694 RepID=A0ABD1UW98_9LAMI